MKLLFLAHRIPYPPTKGDKIRSWHILRHLAGRHDVFLGAFIDDPADEAHAARLRELCRDCCFVSLSKRRARIASLRGLLAGEPLSVPYYRNRALAAWVRRTLATQKIDAAYIFCAPMAGYLMPAPAGLRRVVDFVDVDSDKWRQYAHSTAFPVSLLYKREARRLLAFEREVARACDANLFVSAKEAELFRKLAPESAGKTDFCNNGVDLAYFDPRHSFPSPFAAGERPLVFTGAMDYWPNIEGVRWFAEEVMPRLRIRHPDLRFHIVGANPTAEVRALATDGVVVTGRVPDVRPYLAHAAMVVCPLRLSRGIQNKVLEGMAMAKLVVATGAAIEGLAVRPGSELLQADDSGEFCRTISEELADGRADAIGRAARARVQSDYAWAPNLTAMEAWLKGERRHVVAGEQRRAAG